MPENRSLNKVNARQTLVLAGDFARYQRGQLTRGWMKGLQQRYIYYAANYQLIRRKRPILGCFQLFNGIRLLMRREVKRELFMMLDGDELDAWRFRAR